MARDYKYRANQNKTKPQQIGIAWWKWFLIIVLIVLFTTFLVFLRNSGQETEQQQKTQSTSIKNKISLSKAPPSHQNKANEEPHFDFYTILPETEIVIPDYEINTRNREEKFGKGKQRKYLIQAGSFREYKEADKLRARLALMGIESKVEKAKVGNVIWNRVKMGPYRRSSSVAIIKKRLKSSGIDVIVLEIKG